MDWAYGEVGGGGGRGDQGLPGALSTACPFFQLFKGSWVVKRVDAKRSHHKEKDFFFNLNELMDVS